MPSALRDATGRIAHACLDRVIRRARCHGGDRGDVPGWVLITVMTAGLVTVLWGVASDQLQEIFRGAVSAVTAP
jgi:hypothetical protein